MPSPVRHVSTSNGWIPCGHHGSCGDREQPPPPTSQTAIPFPCEIVLVRPSGNMAGRCSDSSGPAVLLSGGNLPAIRPNRPPRPDGPPVRLCPDKGLCWVNCLRVTRRNSPSPRPGAHLTVRPPPRPTWPSPCRRPGTNVSASLVPVAVKVRLPLLHGQPMDILCSA